MDTYAAPQNLKYSKNHIWVKLIDDFSACCGITKFQADNLTEILFVDLPERGIEIDIDEKAGLLESIIDLFYLKSPLSGRITKTNETLDETPKTVNSKPFDDGWLFIIEYRDKYELDLLMDTGEYEDFTHYW